MDLSKLPDAQRQELEQLQKQFHEHQAQQQQQSAAAAAAASVAAAAAVQQQPPAYDPSQVQQSYDPSQAYDQSYYYNYNYQDPSQLQQHQQYDASYYQNYYPNAYQQPPHDPYTHPPVEQQRNAGAGSGSGSLGSGQVQVQDTYVHPANPGYPVPPGLNAAAAAAVAALSQLTQFAGSMGAAERATGGGYVGGHAHGHYDQGQGQGQGHFRPPPVGHTPPPPYRGGGRRGGGPFRGGGRGNFGFRPPSSGGRGPPFHGRGRGGRGRGRGGRPDHPASSHPVEGAKPSEGGGAEPSVKIAWCELCRVDCTSKEILETHKNGKRHQKNLQRLQEMKGEYKPVAETEIDEKPGSEMNKTVQENEMKADDDREKKPWMKRKVKGGGGRGGKRQRLGATGPPKPKVVIPLMCDLCNVKCDTQEVFDRHVGGKKHIAKLKRFQGHQAMYGPTAVQALYPPNPLLLSQAQSMSVGPTLTQPPNIAAPPPAPTYVPPQNPNPQLADAPLQFGTQNAATAAAVSELPQPAQLSTAGVQ